LTLTSRLTALDTRIHARATRWRWILAGPVAFVLSVLLMATLPLVLPAGSGGINHLVLPVLFFPLLWSITCIWPVATQALGRCLVAYLGLSALCLASIVLNSML